MSVMDSNRYSVEESSRTEPSAEKNSTSDRNSKLLAERRPLIRWLSVVGALILLMVLIGGITRLTGSGLSMVDWRPLMGTIPPLSDAEWQKVFDQYQQYPEYKLINHRMTLPEFKQIFFWEYLHRLLGRAVGIAFLIPWLYFIWRRRIPPGFNGRFAGLFALGAAQGLMGWYMVKSGLVDVPNVSHYRLAAHLALAFASLALTFWFILRLGDVKLRETAFSPEILRRLAFGFTGLVCAQIIWGAFTAGLDAGFGHNTFPLMGGEVFPRGMWILEPAWANIFDNNITVQFMHRTLGWLVFFSGLGLMIYIRNLNVVSRVRRAVGLIGWLALAQFGLGVATLLTVVALPLAVLHQLGAAALLLAALNLNYVTAKRAGSNALPD